MTKSQIPDSWWQKTSIYQIYPRSFYDSNGDGIGDIKGIIQKLDYIKDLGFETIWCSPFFLSPQQDFGYDISDYRQIAPEYGNLNDADELISEVHRRGMKIVFDMVMNHTSAEHSWFLKDELKQNKGDFYIWTDKPNNWKSMVGGSSWHYSPTRKQYYLASFLPFQPDLNYRNSEVKAAMFDNVRFWLNKGADGFRLDIFNVIYKDSLLRDNPFSWKALPSGENPDGFFQQMKYNINQGETYAFAKELRAVCKESGDKMLIGEVSGDRKKIRKFQGENTNDGLGLVFNFEMLRFKFNAKYFHKLITNIENEFKGPFTPVYVFSNHDRRRSVKRLKNHPEKAKLLHIFQLTVRGVPCMYYGEEIGMTDGRIPYRKGLDPIAQRNKNVPRFFTDLADETLNRDDVRTPMQWDSTANAGFSVSHKTWLPVNKDHKEKNVIAQTAEINSLLNCIRQLNKIRNSNAAFSSGKMEIYQQTKSKNLLVYKRTDGKTAFYVVLNFSGNKTEIPAAFKAMKKVFSSKGSDSETKVIDAYEGLIFQEQ